MAKSKKEKSTKELTKGLEKFFKGKELREDNAGAFEKVIKKIVKKKKANKPSSK
jgi:hypothetical protein